MMETLSIETNATLEVARLVWPYIANKINSHLWLHKVLFFLVAGFEFVLQQPLGVGPFRKWRDGPCASELRRQMRNKPEIMDEKPISTLPDHIRDDLRALIPVLISILPSELSHVIKLSHDSVWCLEDKQNAALDLGRFPLSEFDEMWALKATETIEKKFQEDLQRKYGTPTVGNWEEGLHTYTHTSTVHRDDDE